MFSLKLPLSWYEYFVPCVIEYGIFSIIIYLLRPPYEMALILTLEGAAPPITAVPIVTERMRGNTGMVNQYLIASFLVAIITIPLVMSLLNRIYS